MPDHKTECPECGRTTLYSEENIDRGSAICPNGHRVEL